MFPSRDQLVAHVEHHVGESGIDLLLDRAVDWVEARAISKELRPAAEAPQFVP
jgi:hypothetical protein